MTNQQGGTMTDKQPPRKQPTWQRAAEGLTDRQLAEQTAYHTKRAADMATFLVVLVVLGVVLSSCSALLNL